MFFFRKKKPEVIRKHYKSGVEMEFFLIDQKGKIVNSAPEVIKETKARYPESSIVPEVGQNMIELASSPEIYIPELMKNMIVDLEKIAEVAKAMGFVIFPYGTYPGKYFPEMTPNKRYNIQEQIFGKKRFSNSMRCAGVHTHFTLPWGVFDAENLTIKTMPQDSKYKEAMMNTFNFYIAADPALTTFAQSSPFFQGENFAKDTRMVMYRSGALKNPDSLYANFPEYGSLHSYILTNTDMLHAIEERFSKWSDILRDIKQTTKSFLKNGSVLGTTWSPVRINAHGTTESRSMDANLPSVVLATALIMKFVSKHIQENFVSIKISDEGVAYPFTMKDGFLLLPPDSYVINHLQVKSAYEGLENKEVYDYCSAFLKLGESLIPPDRQDFLIPLKKMLESGKTTSDQILDKAIKLGWKKGEELDSEVASKLALMSNDDFMDDLKKSKFLLESYLSSFKADKE